MQYDRRASAAHAPTQLMHLGQSKPLRMFNDHHGCIWHIHPHLNHRGRNQHIQLPRWKRRMMISFSSAVHPSMQQPQAQTLQGAGPQLLYISVAALSEGSAGSETLWNNSPGVLPDALPWGTSCFRFTGGEIQFGLILFCALDYGIDHIRLAPHSHLFPHQAPILRLPSRPKPGG